MTNFVDAADDPQVQAGAAILAFWELARPQVGLARLPVITGLSPAASVAPPAFAFGDSPEIANELLALVLAGTKTATASAVWEYEAAGDPLPQEGDLSIILDGRGHPWALVRTTAVRLAAFADVDAEHAWLEGEDDRSLESWRSGHQGYFGRALAGRNAEFDENLVVVLERFELRYPRRSS